MQTKSFQCAGVLVRVNRLIYIKNSFNSPSEKQHKNKLTVHKTDWGKKLKAYVDFHSAEQGDPGGAAVPGWTAHREPGAASVSGTSSGMGSRVFECIFALSSTGTFRVILKYRGLV